VRDPVQRFLLNGCDVTILPIWIGLDLAPEHRKQRRNVAVPHPN
jgi:hypothetical protein